MRNDKTPFMSDYHTDPEKLVGEKSFKVRVKLFDAVVAHATPMIKEHFSNDYTEMEKLAQKLAFIPIIRSGWGPSEKDITTTAKNMVDCYFAYTSAFSKESFPEPQQAALETLKEFDFAV